MGGPLYMMLNIISHSPAFATRAMLEARLQRARSISPGWQGRRRRPSRAPALRTRASSSIVSLHVQRPIQYGGQGRPTSPAFATRTLLEARLQRAHSISLGWHGRHRRPSRAPALQTQARSRRECAARHYSKDALRISDLPPARPRLQRGRCLRRACSAHRLSEHWSRSLQTTILNARVANAGEFIDSFASCPAIDTVWRTSKAPTSSPSPW